MSFLIPLTKTVGSRLAVGSMFTVFGFDVSRCALNFRLSDSPLMIRQYFIDEDDTVPQKIVLRPDSPRGTHFRRAGPRQRVVFDSDDVVACIVTCGGMCPGLNTVIREIVCGLSYMYGVKKILGFDGGYRGFYARNTIDLDLKTVNDIHKRGGTILGTSRGGHDTTKIVDSIQDSGINQEIRRCGLKVAVAGISKTIDNDIPIID
ncbi:ATP-dependent 6-phosphofructokinase 1 [Raphanus sativus]|nr:ATP-dependent 6-phosphofructokinase 1 [Raphanus sativus]